MSFTFESFAVALILIIPGFAAYSMQRYFRVASPANLSPLELTLISIGYSAIIFLLLVPVFSLVSFLFSLFWKPGSVDLNLLANLGLTGYFLEQPVKIVALLWCWLFLSLVLGALLGYKDPLGSFLETQLARRELSDYDVWNAVLEKQRRMLGKDWSYLSVRLRNADIYRGVLVAHQLTTDKDGSRSLGLASVTYLPEGDVNKAVEVGPNGQTIVVLSSKDILSIEVVYINRGDRIPPESWTVLG